MTVYRQGDYLFIPVDTMPEGKPVKRERGRIIVGRGEVTGHHHAVKSFDVKMIEVPDARHFLVSTSEFAVTHEEHDAVILPAGMYEVRQQRQYVRGELRRVMD